MGFLERHRLGFCPIGPRKGSTVRVLVLGGDGYLGWPTAMSLSAHGHEVAVVDNYLRRQMVNESGSDSLTPILNLSQRAAAWQQVPTTYLVCAQDRGTPPELQREFARRAGKVVELDAGHHPFLSQPAAVRDLVLSL